MPAFYLHNPIIPTGQADDNRSFINLTPCVPLSTLGEGELNLKEGLAPLLNTHLGFSPPHFIFLIKEAPPPISNTSYSKEFLEAKPMRVGGWEIKRPLKHPVNERPPLTSEADIPHNSPWRRLK
jgi:hypothetical protein